MITIVGKARRGFMLILTLKEKDDTYGTSLFNVEVPMIAWIQKTREERVAYLKGQIKLQTSERMWREVEASVDELMDMNLEDEE